MLHPKKAYKVKLKGCRSKDYPLMKTEADLNNPDKIIDELETRLAVASIDKNTSSKMQKWLLLMWIHYSTMPDGLMAIRLQIF
jgi:hypothetical protein